MSLLEAVVKAVVLWVDWGGWVIGSCGWIGLAGLGAGLGTGSYGGPFVMYPISHSDAALH